MNSIDSQEYLSEIVRNHHRKFDYTRFDNLTLGEVCFFSRLLTDQLLFMVLYRSNLLPIGISEWRAIRNGLRAPKNLLQVGTRLCELCHDRQLIGVLSDAILETDMITKELRDRLADKPVGRDLILVDQGRKDLETLQRLLQADKITSYRPSKYDSGDIQQDVLGQNLSTLQATRERCAASIQRTCSIDFSASYSAASRRARVLEQGRAPSMVQ